jgi:hypothetical protein
MVIDNGQDRKPMTLGAELDPVEETSLISNPHTAQIGMIASSRIVNMAAAIFMLLYVV